MELMKLTREVPSSSTSPSILIWGLVRQTWGHLNLVFHKCMKVSISLEWRLVPISTSFPSFYLFSLLLIFIIASLWSRELRVNQGLWEWMRHSFQQKIRATFLSSFHYNSWWYLTLFLAFPTQIQRLLSFRDPHRADQTLMKSPSDHETGDQDSGPGPYLPTILWSWANN